MTPLAIECRHTDPPLRTFTGSTIFRLRCDTARRVAAGTNGAGKTTVVRDADQLTRSRVWEVHVSPRLTSPHHGHLPQTSAMCPNSFQ